MNINNELKSIVLNTLQDKKTFDIKVFDVKNYSIMFDYIVIATANSNRHTFSSGKKIAVEVRKNGFSYKMEGDTKSKWILLDLNYIIVHIMTPDIRNYYNLEEFYMEIPQNDLLEISEL